jgi:hypothetical protein
MKDNLEITTNIAEQETPEAVTDQNVAEIVAEKPYTFRRLETTDMFMMFKLLNKIGFKDLKENESLKQTLFLFMGGTANGKIDVNKLGMEIFFEAASVLFEAIPKAENEIYTLLASVASLKPEDIKKQPPATTFEMIVDFCKKEEFSDFFKVVLKLFK